MIGIKKSALYSALIAFVTFLVIFCILAFIEVSHTTSPAKSDTDSTEDETVVFNTERHFPFEDRDVPIMDIIEILPVQTVCEVPHELYYTDEDAVHIAKVLWLECRGVDSVTEQACVAWTILNRVDQCGLTVYEVVSAPHQFAFSERATLDDELLALAKDVLERWNKEKNGDTDVGRVLPREYTYFYGRGGHNYFRDAYSGNYTVWDYSISSPYVS